MSCVKNIIEDEVDKRRWLVNVAPLGRAPQDKKSSRAINKHARALHDYLDRLITWRKVEKRNKLLDQARELEKKIGKVRVGKRNG